MKRELPPAQWLTETVKVYRNLNAHCLSVKFKSEPIHHAASVILENASFSVSEAGRQRVIAEGRKNVHAYAVGQLMQRSGNAWGLEITNSGMVAIGYNPYAAGYFYRKDTREAVYTAKVLIISASGMIAEL